MSLRALLYAAVLAVVMCLHLAVRSMAFVYISDLYVFGAERFQVYGSTYDYYEPYFVASALEVWARPNTTFRVYGDVHLPGVASGLGELTNEFREVQAAVSDLSALPLHFENLVPPGVTLWAMSPPGANLPFGYLFDLTLQPTASGTYQFSFWLESVHWERNHYWSLYEALCAGEELEELEPSPQGGWLGEWYRSGVTPSDNTVLVTLHVIPDVQTLVLFAVGIGAVVAGTRRRWL